LGLRPVNARGEELTVSGFVSLPACCRGSRNWQFFFVNGRQIRSKLLTAALEEAYANQKMVGKFPACVLHLTTKLNAVDVNVHPAKTEIKFGAERQVFSGVYHAVLSALEAERGHPQAVLRQSQLPNVRERDAVTPNQLKIGAGTPASPFGGGGRAAAGEGPLSLAPLDSSPGGGAKGPAVVRVHDVAAPASWPERKPPVRAERPAPPPRASVPPPETPPPPPAPAPEPEPAPLLPQEEPWRVAGEVLRTYIIVEQGEKVFFIDKHAAHERMNFDRMKAEGYDPMAQTLLTPALCRLSPEEKEVLLANKPLLEAFGFDVDELGDALAVRQAPFDVDAGEVPATLEELAQKLLSTGSADPAAARDALLHTMACKAAIKGGWTTSPQELERVAREVMSGRVKYCPHGRPVAIELTRQQLEKQFKRA